MTFSFRHIADNAVPNTGTMKLKSGDLAHLIVFEKQTPQSKATAGARGALEQMKTLKPTELAKQIVDK
ncbi:hypothetical protein [Paraburkholderia sp. SG-MS1]|uniref:hypothetical protein n=1 Tax=Paraburkholderia sp. SG-MS1 TaxID=2023741 RepID=UPI001EEBBD1A|nr:hypothetical protein [Paraburkholderia sp. SG-MS1]